MKKKLLLILAFIGYFSSCVLIEEPSIEQEEVEIIVPRDSLRTEVSSQLFYWEALPDAINYELQLVAPSFDRIDRFLLDTTINTDKFEYVLSPGTYQWRVRALNASSATPFTYHYLFVDSTFNLGAQRLLLESPSDRDTTASDSILFSWLPLYSATDYEIELWQAEVGQVRVFNQTTFTTSITHVLSNEGAYEWRARARNSAGESAYESQTFFIDQTAPAAPILGLPLSNVSLNADTLSFSWLRSADAGSSITDTLIIATDPDFSQGVLRFETNSNPFEVSGLPIGEYYWRVRAGDKAGNASSFSNTRFFNAQ
jgi:hypothetical protein